jgi:3-hydroxyacyl-CoA dehydrogenase/enoyl-CoA hydratase/3-hydroxybutyryl-CoA epimerase
VSSALSVRAERVDDSALSVELRRDGIAVITLDVTRAKQNSITPTLCAQLANTLDRAEQDPSVAGVVVASAKADFMDGTNADLLKAIKFATDAERFAREVSRSFHRLADLKKPAVAAVHGGAIGGGFELALAAHAIVASDHPSTCFGLPEVRLGLMQAGNGSLRIARRAGLEAAIEVATTGRTLSAVQARAANLVDDICPHAILIEAAAQRARALVGRMADPPRKASLRSLLRGNPLATALVFRSARRETRARTRGHYPAAERILDVLERFANRGFDAAAELEARAFAELVVSETAHRLIEVFFATRELARDRGTAERADPRSVHNAVVVGGGRIGAGVAYACIAAGIGVRLKEEDSSCAGRATKAVVELLQDRQKGDAGEGNAALTVESLLARFSATAEYSGLRVADVVIEAVPDSLAVKQSVLREVERVVGPECIYGSTTLSLSIAQIAQVASRPGRVLGMHYFHPASRVRLLEIVRADKTEPWAVATAVAFAKRQGKTPVVVTDTPGFFTTRVLAPLVAEAVTLVGEGVAIEAVDRALVDWGFFLGPLALLDEVGIDASARVAQALNAAFPDRIHLSGAIAKLLADGRRGRASGRGFYRYPPGVSARTARSVADPGVYDALGRSPTTRLPAEEIQMRCALGLVNEAVRCLGDGVVRRPGDADIAAILGLGFPRFRGGPLRYVDAIGAAETLRRVQGYADRFGERWRPAPLLVHMAKRGERFFP